MIILTTVSYVLITERKFLKFYLVLFILCALIWCYYTSFNHFGLKSDNEAQAIVNTWQYVHNPTSDFRGFFTHTINNLLTHTLYPLLLGIIVGWRKIWFFIFIVLIPLLLILFIDIKSSYWFLPRQYTYLMPLFAFYLGWCWDECV